MKKILLPILLWSSISFGQTGLWMDASIGKKWNKNQSSGIGIGNIGSKAMEAIARQPEVVGDIRSNMILMAALIEGAALIAIILSIFVK